MPNIIITVGGRQFEVACQDGEESFLKAAAEVLDGEAQLLTDQVGRLSESRMLLMAGLMLADKTVVLEESSRFVEKTVGGRSNCGKSCSFHSRRTCGSGCNTSKNY